MRFIKSSLRPATQWPSVPTTKTVQPFLENRIYKRQAIRGLYPTRFRCLAVAELAVINPILTKLTHIHLAASLPPSPSFLMTYNLHIVTHFNIL